MKTLKEKIKELKKSEELVIVKKNGVKVKKIDDNVYGVGFGNENRIRVYIDKDRVLIGEGEENAIAELRENGEAKENYLILKS